MKRGAIVLLLISAVIRPVEALDLGNISRVVNLACVQYAVVGACYCGPYNVCLVVEYWEPSWLIETVKIPGTTSLGSMAPGLQSVFQAAGVPQFGGGGAGNATGGGHTNLQYNEAHVVGFPLEVFGGGPCTGCGGGQNSLTVHYVSEIDALWRTATGPPGWRDLLGRGQLGVWAPLYPRGGKAIHGSEPVGTGIAAARAMDIAARPTGSLTSPESRVVLQPTDANSRCCQLGLPRMTDCLPVGTNPALWEHRTVSEHGTYLWLFWRRRTCCVESSQAFCGLALVGGHGANLCLAQPPDVPR